MMRESIRWSGHCNPAKSELPEPLVFGAESLGEIVFFHLRFRDSKSKSRRGTGFEMTIFMRTGIILIALALAFLMLGGCAAQPAGHGHPVAYQPASAGALAFDPPVLAGSPRMDLSRDGREPSAFAGYADSSTTFTSVAVRNVQGNGDGGNGYVRDAESQTIGVSYR
jgi:hypothetical protein